jgi:hypothetical protein
MICRPGVQPLALTDFTLTPTSAISYQKKGIDLDFAMIQSKIAPIGRRVRSLEGENFNAVQQLYERSRIHNDWLKKGNKFSIPREWMRCPPPQLKPKPHIQSLSL